MDLTRLRHLGFPLDSELHPGKAVIYVDPDIGMRSCTKGGGDLNSLEFCVDDFSSSDIKPESISTTSISIQADKSISATSPQLVNVHEVPETFHIDTIQIEQDSVPEKCQNVGMDLGVMIHRRIRRGKAISQAKVLVRIGSLLMNYE